MINAAAMLLQSFTINIYIYIYTSILSEDIIMMISKRGSWDIAIPLVYLSRIGFHFGSVNMSL